VERRGGDRAVGEDVGARSRRVEVTPECAGDATGGENEVWDWRGVFEVVPCAG